MKPWSAAVYVAAVTTLVAAAVAVVMVAIQLVSEAVVASIHFIMLLILRGWSA
jgi:hypothetical protein